MSAARASGTDLASTLKQNTFLTLKVRPVGGPRGPRGTGGRGGPFFMRRVPLPGLPIFIKNWECAFFENGIFFVKICACLNLEVLSVPGFRRFPNFWKIFENYRKLHMPQSRRRECPRSSRLQHSNPCGASCLSSASVAQMLAAASI